MKMNRLNRVNATLQAVEALVGTILLASLLFIISLNIILRYFFSVPFFWTEELSSYLFVWAGLLSSAFVMGESGHIRITTILDRVSIRIRLLIEIIMNLLILSFLISFIPPSIKVLKLLNTSPALHIHESYIYTIIPLSFGLMALHLIIEVLKQISLLRVQKEEVQNGFSDFSA
jgi:TRAP-type C4-dicarboxylate transport system permease small subunit